MKNILVTGAAGFVGKNLIAALKRLEDISLTMIVSADDRSVLDNALLKVDVIYHLAGVNRPQHEEVLTLAELDLAQIRRTRARLPMLGDERPELVVQELQRILEERK